MVLVEREIWGDESDAFITSALLDQLLEQKNSQRNICWGEQTSYGYVQSAKMLVPIISMEKKNNRCTGSWDLSLQCVILGEYSIFILAAQGYFSSLFLRLVPGWLDLFTNVFYWTEQSVPCLSFLAVSHNSRVGHIDTSPPSLSHNLPARTQCYYRLLWWAPRTQGWSKLYYTYNETVAEFPYTILPLTHSITGNTLIPSVHF